MVFLCRDYFLVSLLLYLFCSNIGVSAGRFLHEYNLTSLEGLKTGKAYSVLADGPAKCLFGEPYVFQVFPGTTDKLMVFFQGGGLCWDANSIKTGQCFTDLNIFHPVGMLDRRKDSKSAFHRYTLVVIEYCSGDASVGSIRKALYEGPEGEKIQHMGKFNALAVLEWIMMQQSSGSLSSPLADLVIVGASAGCISTYMWAPNFLHSIKWKKSVVILDSIVVPLPPKSLGAFLNTFNGCQFLQYLLPPTLLERCYQADLNTSELIIESLNHNPSVPYVFIIAKEDSYGQMFYNDFGFNGHYLSHGVSSKFVYDMMNHQLVEISSRTRNAVIFLVNGEQHVFTNRDAFFAYDVRHGIGSDDPADAAVAGPLRVQELLEQFPLHPGQTVHNVCLGTKVDAVVGEIRHPVAVASTVGNSSEGKSGGKGHIDPSLRDCGEVTKDEFLCFKHMVNGAEVDVSEAQGRYCMNSIAAGAFRQLAN